MTKYALAIIFTITGCGAAQTQAVRPGTVVIDTTEYARLQASDRRAEALVREQITDEERTAAEEAYVRTHADELDRRAREEAARRAAQRAQEEAAREARRPTPPPAPRPVVSAPAPQPVAVAPVTPPPAPRPAPRSEPRQPDQLDVLLDALLSSDAPAAPPARAPFQGMGYAATPGQSSYGAPAAPMSYDYTAMPESMARQLGIIQPDGTCGRCMRVRLENVPMSRAIGLTVDGVRIRVIERDTAVPYPARTAGRGAIPTIESTGGVGMTYVIPLPTASRVRVGVECLTADRAQSSDVLMSRSVSYDAAAAGRYRTGIFRVSPAFCR